jgi:hypothetical protein
MRSARCMSTQNDQVDVSRDALLGVLAVGALPPCSSTSSA